MFTPGSAGGRSVLVWEGPAALKAAGAQVGADRWCDKVGPVVVSYHTGGPSRSSRVLPGEMTRQLDGQFKALSLMSAEEILTGMTTYDERKRSPASHTAIRRKFREKLTKDLKGRHHFSPKAAELWARRAMKELAVLHNPDQLLAGPQGPSLVRGLAVLGDLATNSALGSQTAKGPRELIRAAAQKAVDAGQGDRLLRMRVVLTDSPDLAKRLNAGSEVLEPRSLAEREAVSPRGSLLTVQVLSDRLAQALGGPGGLKALTRDKLRQALTQPPAQTPDPPDTPTPDGPGTDAPDMASPDGLDTAGLDGGAPDIGAPDRGAPEAPASAPVASQPVPDRIAPEQSRPDGVVPEASAPEQTRPDKGVPDAGAPDAGSPGRGAPNAGAPDAGSPGRGAPSAGASDGGAPGSPAQAQAPAAGRTTPPSVPPVSAEPPVVPARSQRAASPTAPKQPAQPVQPGRPTQPGQPPQPGQSGKPGRPGQPVQSSRSGRQGRLAQPGQPGQSGRSAQPGRQSQPVQSGQSGRPAQPSQPGRSAQPRQPVQAGGSGLSGRGAAGVGASGANAWLEASSRLQASQKTGTPSAPARSGPQVGPLTPAAPVQPAPQRSTSGPTAGETPSRTVGDAPSRSAGGRGTDTTSRTAPRSTSRSQSRSAGVSASRGRAAAQDPIKAFLAPTGDPQRDAVLAGISSKLDKLRERNQQRQPTQAPTRTTPTHHPHR